MNHSPDTLQASYRFCRSMCRRAKSNFSISFLLLPKNKCRAMHALYAFMRHTDDLADNDQPADVRAEMLHQWRATLDGALADSEVVLPSDDPGRNLLPALADTVRTFHIPREHLHAVIDGVEMDLTPRRYETFGDLEVYCRRVASAVGVACLHIWGFRGPEALTSAHQCGLAMQLTNILRDLGEDAREGRVYLPMDELRQCGYAPENLADNLTRGIADESFDRLMRFQIDRAAGFYVEGARLFDWLEPDGRRIFGTMMSTYRALLTQIERDPSQVLRRRVRLSATKKLWIAARWMLVPPRTVPMP